MNRLNVNNSVHWMILSLLTIIIYYPFSFFTPSSIIISILVSIIYARKIKELRLNNYVYLLSQIIIGCFIGLSINLDDIISSNIPFYFLIFISTLLIILSLIVGLLAVKSKFLPGTTGLWGMLPGAAPVMIILSEQKDAVPGLVAFIQYTRVIFVSLLASTVIILHDHAKLQENLDQNSHYGIEVILFFIAIIFFIFLTLNFLKKNLNIFLLSILYAFILNTIAPPIKVPNLILAFGFIILGWNIGFNLTTKILIAARKSFMRVFFLITVLILLCYFLSFLLVYFFNIDPLTAYLATSPGGIDSIAIISSGTSAVLPIVISFQLIRFLILLFFGEKIVNFSYKIYIKFIDPKIENKN